MGIFSGRLFALIKKEFLILFRDPKVRLVLIGPPLVQLFIFSFAATLEVKNITLAVHNQDFGKHGIEIVERFASSSLVKKLIFVEREKDFYTLLDEQRALAVVQIPKDFSRHIEQKTPASIQFLFDGRRSNAAQIVNGYFLRIVATYQQELQELEAQTPKLQKGQVPIALTTVERHWFNENLQFSWVTVSSLVGVLAMLITLMVTALSVAREKELGTFAQLLVSPLMPGEILLGKTLPAMAVGFCEGLLIYLVSYFMFDVPFRGSLALLLLCLCVFIYSIVGIGLFISALVKTQQQAILGAFVFMVPAMALSGFAAPVDNMPEWIQVGTNANPLKFGIIMFKGIFLKDMSLAEAWHSIWPLLIIGTTTLAIASAFFTRRLE